jgi:hypothetical protein
VCETRRRLGASDESDRVGADRRAARDVACIALGFAPSVALVLAFSPRASDAPAPAPVRTAVAVEVVDEKLP